jgi:hypothetical protein
MIAGYTAASMLKGEMTDKDALHKAMLMGISRYQDVVQASQNDQDPLTTYLTQFSDGDEIRVEEGDHLSSFYLHALDGIISSDTSISVLQKGSFSIPPQGGDKAWKAKLEWLRTRKPDDKEKIAAVVIKGASAFSIMINQDDSVQITDSHPSRFGKKAAFSKTFRSLEAAAIFLNALYPYTPPRNGRIEITTKNQVEFTPLVLPDHQTQKNEDIRYAEDPTLLGLLTYCAPPQESPQPAAPTFPPLRLPQGIQQKHIQIIQEIQQAAIIDEMNIAAKKLGALAENQDSVALQLQENFRGIAPSGSSKDQMILIIKKRATQLLGAIQRNIQPTLSTAPLPASFSAVKTDDELIADFYSGSPIPTGRGMGDGTTTLRNILSFSDTQLEHEHRYIQWLFPTPYPSEAQRGSPHYNTPNESILKNAQNTQFRGNMQAALQRMIQFYGGIPSRDSSGHLLIAPSTSRFTDHIVNGDHNLLRITRIIQSLRLHGLYNDAQAFYNFVTPRAKRNGVSEETLNYWREALKLEVPQKH